MDSAGGDEPNNNKQNSQIVTEMWISLKCYYVVLHDCQYNVSRHIPVYVDNSV